MSGVICNIISKYLKFELFVSYLLIFLQIFKYFDVCGNAIIFIWYLRILNLVKYIYIYINESLSLFDSKN